MIGSFVVAAVSILGTGTEAYGPSSVPIKWMGSNGREQVLIPKGLKLLSDGLAPPQSLTTIDPLEDLLPDAIPRFTVKPGGAISLGNHEEWCIEAPGGARSGSAVRVNRCNGRPDQKWNWIPDSHGRNIIQLKDTKMCLGKDGSDGTPVVLSECEDAAMAVWKFEDIDSHPNPARLEESRTSSTMRHLMLALASVAVVSLAAGVWQKRITAKREAMALCGASASADLQGGISLMPLMHEEFSIHGYDKSVGSRCSVPSRTGSTMLASGGGVAVLEKPSDKPTFKQSRLPTGFGPQLQLGGAGGGGDHVICGNGGGGGGYHMRMLSTQEQAIVFDEWKARSGVYRMTDNEAIKEVHNKQVERLGELNGFAEQLAGVPSPPRALLALFQNAPELALPGTVADTDQAMKVKVVIGVELLKEFKFEGPSARLSVQHMAFTPSGLNSHDKRVSLYEDALDHVEGVALALGYSLDKTPFEINPNYEWLARR